MTKEFALPDPKWSKKGGEGVSKEYLTPDECEVIKKDLIDVLKKHQLTSGLARVALNETIDYVDNFSTLT